MYKKCFCNFYILTNKILFKQIVHFVRILVVDPVYTHTHIYIYIYIYKILKIYMKYILNNLRNIFLHFHILVLLFYFPYILYARFYEEGETILC